MNSKNTRKALVLSLLSLLLCCSMLVGTTFAWFTDSVVSGNNRIVAGNLDVELEYLANGQWVAVNENTNVFAQNTLWEPGHTEVIYLKVSNLGTLALKYQLGINIASEVTSVNVYDETLTLSDHIMMGVIEGKDTAYASREEARAALDETTVKPISERYAKAGTLYPLNNIPAEEGAAAAAYVALVVYMPEEVGNEANYKTGFAAPEITLGIDLRAAQKTYEEDTFDDQYDADAEIPLLPGKFNITNNEELVYALNCGGEGFVMNSFDGAFGKLPAENELVLDLKGETITGGTVATGDVDGGEAAIESSGTLTIKNGTIESDYITVDNKKGTMKLENLTLNTTDVLYGFYQRAGETILDDVTINAIRGGFNIKGGKVTVNGGSVFVKGKSSKTGYQFFVYGESTELVINGGEYTYGNGYRNFGVIYADGADVVINGGSFGKGGSSYSAKWIQALNGGTVTIYGGSFEFDPSAFVAEGYQAVKGDDGWWVVSAISG